MADLGALTLKFSDLGYKVVATSGFPAFAIHAPAEANGQRAVASWLDRTLVANPISVPTGGRLSGTVTANGVPVPYAQVRLYYRPTGMQIASMRSDASGNFAVNGLPTNGADYFAMAFDPDGGVMYNASVFDHLTPVEILFTAKLFHNSFMPAVFGGSTIALATLPASDPYWSSVASLLHFDGANGSTTFTDEKGRTWTGSGAAQISTAQSVFGGSSLRLNGSSRISTASSADFAYGTGDFSWEFRFRLDSTAGNQYLLDHGANGGTITYNGILRYYNVTIGTGSTLYTGGPVLSADTWYTLTIDRVAGVTTLRVDGVTVASAADTHNYVAQAVWIGEYGGGGYQVTGYVDELRITKGVARYTADFTPPAQPFPNTGA